MKNYRLKKEQIKQLIPPMGGCLATDMITVDGECIMFMYREHPKNQMDSGWRFFSGLEDEKYMRNNDNHSVYDVNTIANYDPSIIPYLGAEVGSSFERDEKTSLFNKILEQPFANNKGRIPINTQEQDHHNLFLQPQPQNARKQAMPAWHPVKPAWLLAYTADSSQTAISRALPVG